MPAKPGADAGDDATAESRTLRMLLELQQAVPADAPKEARREPTPMARAAVTLHAPTAGATDAVTSGSKRDQPRAQPQSEWKPLATGPGLDGDDRPLHGAGSVPMATRPGGFAATESFGAARSTTSAAHDDYVEAKRLMPAGLVQFLRTNRDWILVSSLALVAGVWVLGAASRRRR